MKKRPSVLKTYLYEKEKFLNDPYVCADPLLAARQARSMISLKKQVERQAEKDDVPAGVFWIYEEVTQ